MLCDVDRDGKERGGNKRREGVGRDLVQWKSKNQLRKDGRIKQELRRRYLKTESRLSH